MANQIQTADKTVVQSLDFLQALLVKPDRGQSRLPLTRADWYIDPK